jgi:hypothetical protein
MVESVRASLVVELFETIAVQPMTLVSAADKDLAMGAIQALHVAEHTRMCEGKACIL